MFNIVDLLTPLWLKRRHPVLICTLEVFTIFKTSLCLKDVFTDLNEGSAVTFQTPILVSRVTTLFDMESVLIW